MCLLKRIYAYTVLALWTIIMTVPMYWIIITSFKTGEAQGSKATFVPWVDFEPSLQAWVASFRPTSATGGSISVTVPIFVQNLINSAQNVGWWTVAAIGISSFLPLAVVALLLERYIRRGLTMGAVK
jgi:multiple sugar transport system permease protein